MNWIVEYVSAPSQMGTHMDALNHLQVGDRTYNGHRLDDIVEQHGTNRLGVDTLPQVVTRGVLLDVAAVRPLRGGDVLTPRDASAALERAVPQTLNTHHGVVVLENLRLTDAAAAGLTEFLFVVTHAKLRGATGAWVAPLAIT